MNTTKLKDDDITGGGSFPLFHNGFPFNNNAKEDPHGEIIENPIIGKWWISEDYTTIEALILNQTIRFMVKIPIPKHIKLSYYGEDILTAFYASYRYPEIITPIYCYFDISEKFFSLTVDLDCRSADSETPKEIHFDFI